MINLDTMELTESQKTALEGFSDWVVQLEKYKNSQVSDLFEPAKSFAFRLNGEAGTGKTYLMTKFIEVLTDSKFKVAPIAFTGKAASRLMESTKCPSCTIHKLIYNYNLGEVEFFESSIEEQKAYDEGRTLNRVLECEVLIIDEYSMLSRKMMDDLISLEKILIFVGDLNQLPPIGEEPISDEEFEQLFSEKVPTYNLIEPVRQGEHNPILQLARKIKNGLTNLKEYTTTSQYSHYTVRVEKEPKPDPKQFGLDENIIICGTNIIRHKINKVVRKNLNFKKLLEQDEKIIIMKNNAEDKVYNGESYRILEIIGEQKTEYGLTYQDIIIDRGNENYTVRQYLKVWLDPLLTGSYQYQAKEEFNKALQYQLFKKLTHIAYGYAITCHKAQGSEWNKVYIRYDDVKYDKKRWLYTALTRAKSHAIIKIR